MSIRQLSLASLFRLYRSDRHELGVHRDDNDGRRGAGRRMVAEAERGGRVAEAVHHLWPGGAGVGRRMALADQRSRPVLHGRVGDEVAGRTKVRRTDIACGWCVAAGPI